MMRKTIYVILVLSTSIYFACAKSDKNKNSTEGNNLNNETVKQVESGSMTIPVSAIEAKIVKGYYEMLFNSIGTPERIKVLKADVDEFQDYINKMTNNYLKSNNIDEMTFMYLLDKCHQLPEYQKLDEEYTSAGLAEINQVRFKK
jgi:hypothetical protein